jgi:hypothetical protein
MNELRNGWPSIVPMQEIVSDPPEADLRPLTCPGFIQESGDARDTLAYASGYTVVSK